MPAETRAPCSQRFLCFKALPVTLFDRALEAMTAHEVHPLQVDDEVVAGAVTYLGLR